MQFHLTHTGYYAGLPICGSTVRTPNDQHPSYSEAGIARQLANCCPDCRQAWEDADPCPDCHGAECGGRGCQS